MVILLFKRVRGKNPLTEAEAKEVAFFLKSYHKKKFKNENKYSFITNP